MFKAQEGATGEPFVVSMPPPNVTGALHMGHAMFVTLEDIMVHYYPVLSVHLPRQLESQPASSRRRQTARMLHVVGSLSQRERYNS